MKLVNVHVYKILNECQDLEEKIEAAADELRQERKRLNTATLERDRFEKVSAKLKDITRQLEGRLAEEERISGEDVPDTEREIYRYVRCVVVGSRTHHIVFDGSLAHGCGLKCRR